MWKSYDTFSSACCVDSSNGAVYRLKNLWNSSEANATKWFLHLRFQPSYSMCITTEGETFELHKDEKLGGGELHALIIINYVANSRSYTVKLHVHILNGV